MQTTAGLCGWKFCAPTFSRSTLPRTHAESARARERERDVPNPSFLAHSAITHAHTQTHTHTYAHRCHNYTSCCHTLGALTLQSRMTHKYVLFCNSLKWSYHFLHAHMHTCTHAHSVLSRVRYSKRLILSAGVE